jgi:hypothetical protein
MIFPSFIVPAGSKLAGMFRSHLILIAMVAIASVATGIAQDGEISIHSKVNPNQIKEWLEGSDSRLTAWGAYFASTSDDANNDDAYVTIMARRMARWNPSRMEPSYAGSAMSEILYALIEKNERVPVVSLTSIMSAFPTETLILAARLPAEDAAPFLQDWYDERIPLQTSIQSGNRIKATPFAYVAAMLLAKAPPAGFAASVLAESGERLSFWVADGMYQKSHWTGGGTAACKDADRVIDPPPPQLQDEVSKWPPLFQYRLQSDSSQYGGTLLVDVGGERISYRRISAWIRPTQCYFPDVLTDDTQHHVVAELLGVKDQEMPWPTHQDVICIPECKERFLPALTKQIYLEESKFRATVKALQEKGYLTQSEANTVRPKLAVIINDVRTSVYDGQDHPPPPLPTLVPPDSRTFITYQKR